MSENATPDDSRQITVCDACLRACCWHGIFYCEDYKSAGTVTKTIAQLRKLNREHESYWEGAE